MAQEDLIISVKLQIEQYKKQQAALLKKVQAGNIKAAQSYTQLEGKINSLNKSITTTPFAGWAMSIMFAGMAIQRTFSGISKSSQKAFQEIAHSVEGTVTQTDMLDGSFKYLGYTIGDALDPLIGYLIPIIDTISNWVSENPKLTAGIITLGTALGSLMMVGGGLVLAINGMKDFISIAKNANWANIGQSISKGLGAIAIGYALMEAKDAYADFKEGKWINGLLGALSAGLTGYGGIRLLSGKSGAGFIALGVSLDLIQKGVFFQTIYSVIGLVSALFIAMIKQIQHNFEQGLWKGIVQTLLDIANWLSGVSILSFLEFDFAKDIQEAQRKLTGVSQFDFGSAFKEGYSGTMAQAKAADQVINYYVSNMEVSANDSEQLGSEVARLAGK